MATLELDLEAHKLIEAHRRSLEEDQFSILKRALKNQISGTNGPTRRGGGRTRRTGDFFVRIGNRRTRTPNQKAAYKQALSWMAEIDDGFLDALAQKRIRNRRIVARRPDALYARSGLQRFAEPLGDGWYADTNLSKQQKGVRLREACDLLGLAFGRDVEVGFR
jgi:hypothetical protein